MRPDGRISGGVGGQVPPQEKIKEDQMDKGFRIGPIEVKPATALAPMEGITDASFRRLIRKCGGCGLTVTEFVNCEALAREVDRTWSKTKTDDEGPASVQIYGRDPERLALAAQMCEARGAQIVDLNLGCPAKQVVSGNAGSALMKEPALCARIFRAVREAISIPLTVKMRLGWNAHSMNALEIARMAQEEGLQMVVVHGRTREEGYRGRSHWECVRPIAEALHIPVLVNGDILTRADARRAIELSGASGIMVGRGLLRNPWLLCQIAQENAGEPVFEPSLEARCAFVCEYMDSLASLDISPGGVLGKIKCFLGYFTRGLAYSSQMRERAYRLDTVEAVRAAVLSYFEMLSREKLDGVFDEVVAEAGVNDRFKEGDPRRMDSV